LGLIGHFLGDVGPFLEMVRPWVAPSALLGILGLLLANQVANRRVKNQEQLTANADEVNIRDHYAKEVAQLRAALANRAANHRDELAHYRKLAKEAEERHEECQRQRDEMREKMNALRDLVAGLQRTIIANAATTAQALGDSDAGPLVSDDVKAAAARVEELFRKGTAE
jgi:chromosome segregation ATPase